MTTYHIHIEGQVQGVGFRPFVWRVAKQYGLNGWISNGTDGVHIEITGEAITCQLFYDEVVGNPPEQARIIRHVMTEKTLVPYVDFSVHESMRTGSADIQITPDLGICDHCKEELRNPDDRRYQYAFTTCTHCGPRYSIQGAIPFDRKHTVMGLFPLCATCNSEYTCPDDERFHAQTLSCPTCGIKLTLYNSQGFDVSCDTRDIISTVAAQLEQGYIIALKNVGGYLLLCDATNETAITRLRQRKRRVSKPFALLYPSLEAVKQDAAVSIQEAEAITSPAAPIVLLRSKKNKAIPLHAIAPSLDHIGVMLPYSPLMVMIMDKVDIPLIATSANVSGSPIYFRDQEALKEFSHIADYFLTNNREILIPQDDSVIRFSTDGRRIVLRRARGFAPGYINDARLSLAAPILAMGADIKSTFALGYHQNIHISQYLGDLSSFDTQRNFQDTLKHMLQLLQVKPSIVLTDLHPEYLSSNLGKQVALHHHAFVLQIQHHEAHFAAVLAENNLQHDTEPILGVIFDGTGYGTDGNIWGGEFFTFYQGDFDRVDHIGYFDHILGDKFSRQPRLAALSLCRNNAKARSILENKFSHDEWRIYHKMLAQGDALKTSSAGRLFDAVACLLDLCDHLSYEGEAALLLETLACSITPYEIATTRVFDLEENYSVEKLIGCVVDELAAGTPKHIIAYNFHRALVCLIASIAGKAGVEKICFSGGVFQNALLVDLLEQEFSGRFRLYFHQQLSPNDECISLGQLAWYAISTGDIDKEMFANKTINYVSGNSW